MPIIANLNEQVSAVLIGSIAKPRAPAEEAAEEQQTMGRSAECATSQAATERDSSLHSIRQESSRVPSLPVWLL